MRCGGAILYCIPYFLLSNSCVMQCGAVWRGCFALCTKRLYFFQRGVIVSCGAFFITCCPLVILFLGWGGHSAIFHECALVSLCIPLHFLVFLTNSSICHCWNFLV